MQDSADFQALRRSFRSFVFPMTAAFLVWYFAYVLLAAYATDFFDIPVFGNVNVGILFGLRPVRRDGRHHHRLRALDRPQPRRPGRRDRQPGPSGRGPPVSAVLAAAAPAEAVGNPLLNITIFVLFVAVTLVVVVRASSNNKTAADYYAAGRSFTGGQNGTAIAGDYLSAASFLGIAGAIAVNGYDGFLYSIGFLVAWLVALLLVAELLRNTGKFTMADVLSFRLRQRPVRVAAATDDPRGVVLLPAGPDGGRGRPGGPAAQRPVQGRAVASSSPSSARS